VRFLPYLTGERSPNWPDATGALVGLRPGTLANPAVPYRAAVEGVTYALLAGVKRMSELGLPSPDAVKVVGGGSKSPLWRQTIADAFGVRCEGRWRVRARRSGRRCRRRRRWRM